MNAFLSAPPLASLATSAPRALTLTALAALCSALGCDNPKIPPLGSLELTTTASTTELTTADGWSVKFDRFLVHVSQVSVAGADGVVAAQATPQIFDLVAPGTKSILSATNRTARTWEDVSLEIGPASDANEATPVAPVTEADRDTMAKGRIALHVEGHATGASGTKAFKWDFTTDTTFGDCQENSRRGLVVPANGRDTAVLIMSGDVLFLDDLTAGMPRAATIANADENNDGLVTLEELHARPLDAVRAEAGSAYDASLRPEIQDLGAFIEALVPRLVTRFRAAGRCTGTPAASAAAQP